MPVKLAAKQALKSNLLVLIPMVANIIENVNIITIENCWDDIDCLVAQSDILELFNHLRDTYKSEYPDNDRIIKFQLNLYYICTPEDPKPDRKLINRRFYDSINRVPSSEKAFDLQHPGIVEKPGFLWHTVKAPIGFFLTLIQHGFIYRLAIKKNGNSKEHIVEVWGEGYDIDGINLTKDDMMETFHRFTEWQEGQYPACLHTSPTATQENLKHRVLLIYPEPITDYRITEASLKIRLQRLGVDIETVDQSCKDAGRFFYSRPDEEWRRRYELYMTDENLFVYAEGSFEAAKKLDAKKSKKSRPSNVVPFKPHTTPGMKQTRSRVFTFIHDEIFRDTFNFEGDTLYQSAIEYTGVEWDLEAKQCPSSDTEIQTKWKCSNPGSIENSSKEGLCISYYPNKNQPPGWCDSSSSETDEEKILDGGSIIDFIGWFTSDFQSHKVTDDEEWFTLAKGFIEHLGFEYPFVESDLSEFKTINTTDDDKLPCAEDLTIMFIKFLDRKVFKISAKDPGNGEAVFYYHNGLRYEIIGKGFLREQFADWFRDKYNMEPMVTLVEKVMKAILHLPQKHRVDEPIKKELNKFCFKNANYQKD